MPEVTQQQVEAFLMQVMEIQHEHAHEQKNAKSKRQSKIRECLDKHASGGAG